MIGFIGHHDCLTTEKALDQIAARHPGETWLPGEAAGFDRPVADYCRRHNLRTVVIYPDYDAYPAKKAPLVRNDTSVDFSDVIYACYDGRERGRDRRWTDRAWRHFAPAQEQPTRPVG